jgi:hypothetical protein
VAQTKLIPNRNTALIEAAEKRLTEKLGSFFADRARHVSRQIFERIAREIYVLDNARKSSDHSGAAELHVKPENAQPIYGIRVADVVTRANVQHISWEMVREGKTATERMTLPLSAIIVTQQVIDRSRVDKQADQLRHGEGLEPEQLAPLALFWDGDYFLLGGHHSLQAAYDIGVKNVTIDVMIAPGSSGNADR